MFIAVRSDKCARHVTSKEEANGDAPFFRLSEKRFAHRGSIRRLFVTLEEHYGLWVEFIHEFAELDVGRNPRGIYALPKTLYSPIEKALGAFEYRKSKPTRSEIDGDDSLARIRLIHGSYLIFWRCGMQCSTSHCSLYTKRLFPLAGFFVPSSTARRCAR